MKKINKNGFAITIMLYSILAVISMVMILILSTMSGSRKNNSDLIDHIKDDLNNVSYSKTKTFTYTGTPQEYIVGKEGYYQIELWGAAGTYGQGVGDSKVAGKGAYTSGIIYLNAGQKLYFYVGQQGQVGCEDYLTCNTLSFNGGGLGGYFTTSKSYRVSSGGGATDVRLEPGEWNDLNSLKSRIMVAAGGGGGDDVNTGSNGGTLIGEDGNPMNSGSVAGGGGTQTSGGSSGENSGEFGFGGNAIIPYPTISNCNEAYGGGGGYYGGGGGKSGNPSQNPSVNGKCMIRGYGGGGSSFISGYAGVNAVTSDTTLMHSRNTLHYSGKYFQNGNMIAGVNAGNGQATIKFIGTEIIKKIDQLNNVRYIKDCINGNTVDSTNYWVELQAIQNGNNVAKGKYVTSTDRNSTNLPRITDGDITTSLYATAGSGKQCIVVDLNEPRNLDEIAVWHYYEDRRSYKDRSISVSADNKNWIILTSGTIGETETPTGIRLNAYK